MASAILGQNTTRQSKNDFDSLKKTRLAGYRTQRLEFYFQGAGILRPPLTKLSCRQLSKIQYHDNNNSVWHQNSLIFPPDPTFHADTLSGSKFSYRERKEECALCSRRSGGSQLGSYLDPDPDPWKILWFLVQTFGSWSGSKTLTLCRRLFLFWGHATS